MGQALKHRHARVIELTEGVWVNTTIASEQHSALRSGFAGYPSNPRWNVTKFYAWKTGRQWRKALSQGEMVVRTVDSMLVTKEETEDNSEELPSSYTLSLPVGIQTISVAYQMA